MPRNDRGLKYFIQDTSLGLDFSLIQLIKIYV